MKIIYKYSLGSDSHQNVAYSLPKGGEIVSVAEQHGFVTLWILADREVVARGEMEIRRFDTYLTGELIPDVPRKFLGTVLLEGGSFVLHVFERLS